MKFTNILSPTMTVDSIMSVFTATITNLNKVADDCTSASLRAEARAAIFRAEAAAQATEAARAEALVQRLNSLLSY